MESKRNNLLNSVVIGLFIKGISAIIEIAIQMLITNSIGISEYGNYTFYVSLIEGTYYILFSGSIKINTFYLSTPTYSLNSFKKKYVTRYVTPIILTIIGVSYFFRNPYGIISGIILFIYYVAIDYCSVFYSKGLYIIALLGEYLIGRIFLLIGIYSVLKIDKGNVRSLLILYGLQFIIIVLWFILHKNNIITETNEIKVSIKKLFEYQISDIANSFVSYSPTILQFILGDAFTTGFTGIINIITKFINFISGPTAKVFLPEFSRLYKNGEKEKLEQSYRMIVRIQMIFISTIGVVLIGFPKLFLKMFNPELEGLSNIFVFTSICLLLIAGIGPVTGLLQMTDNERICNRNQWISIIVMIIVWILCRKNPLFSLYGLAVRAIVEGLLKYLSICQWFGKSIISLRNYILLWFPVGIVRFAVFKINCHYSFIALVISVIFVFLWNTGFALRDPLIKSTILNKLPNKKFCKK